MMCKIEKIEALTVGTSAQTVSLGGLACMVQNLTEGATVYIKEKRHDNVAASATNGWAIAAGKSTEIPLVALDLSIISDTASTDVRVMILDLG